MAEVIINAGSVPAGTPYPGTFNDFITSLSSYLTVEFPEELSYAVVSPSLPVGSDQDKVWFRLNNQNGTPQTINFFVNGSWLEFTQFSFGDMVLVAAGSTIIAPWGEAATSYTVAGQQVVTPLTPAAPAGYTYKVYVGNYL